MEKLIFHQTDFLEILLGSFIKAVDYNQFRLILAIITLSTKNCPNLCRYFAASFIGRENIPEIFN
jgi:hypothetical protein